jgi:PAS domain S-box-containing protein
MIGRRSEHEHCKGKLPLDTGDRPSRMPRIPLFIFLIIVLGIAIAGWGIYEKQKEHTRRAAEEYLNVISNLKVRQIVSWRQERFADAAAISENPFNTMRIIPFLRKNPTSEDTGADIQAWMGTLVKNINYYGVSLLDSQGQVRLTIGLPGKKTSAYIQAQVGEVLETGEPRLTDFYWSNTQKRVVITLLVPLHDPRQSDGAARCPGIVLLRVDPNRFLYPLLQVWPTPSLTAETLLVRREGNDVLFLNELRHQKGTSLTLKFPLSEPHLPGAMAVRGLQGMVEGKDYRGVEVIAEILKVPDSPWHMIAKVDQQEIFAPFTTKVRGMVMVISGIILILGIAMLWWDKRREAVFYQGQYEAERERQALVKHFDYLTKYANDIIILTDEKLKIVEANDRTRTAYGYSREELLLLSMHDLQDPQTHSDLERVLGRLEQENGLIYQTAHRRHDGTTFPVEISVRLIEVDDRKFYQAIIRDITERQQAEVALRRSEARYHHTLDTMLEGCQIIDFDWHFVYVNKAVASQARCKPEELLNHTMMEIFPGIEDTELFDSLRHSMEERTSMRMQNKFIYPDGRVAWFELSIQPIPEGIFILSIDITDRQQAEEAIRTLNLQLEHYVRDRTSQLLATNRELEAFSYSVSHDLRAPLRGIDGWTMALLEDYAHLLDDKGKKYLDRVRTETQRMGRLIDDMLSLSRVTRAEMHRETVDLTCLAQSIAGRLRETSPERLVEFVIQDGLIVEGDPRLLEIALVNLLDNAWKFTGQSPIASIELGRVEQEGHSVFFVRDNGTGFDMTYAHKLFGAFQRFHKTSEFPGTGIGLATVQRVVHRHGGRIWADAAVDRGATFHFTLQEAPCPTISFS